MLDFDRTWSHQSSNFRGAGARQSAPGSIASWRYLCLQRPGSGPSAGENLPGTARFPPTIVSGRCRAISIGSSIPRNY